MAQPFLLIDGYNLMHAAGMARQRYGPGELERTREQFLNHLLVRLTPGERRRTTVVFDARDPPVGVPRHMHRQEMRVVFARPGGEADAVIEQLIRRHSAPRQLRVISSDHRLQKAAKRRRARFMDSEEFVRRLERRSPADDASHEDRSPQLDAKFGGDVPAEETEEWLEIFGGTPEAEALDTGTDRLQSEIDALIDEFEAERDERRDGTP